MDKFLSDIAKTFEGFGVVDFLTILLFAAVFYYVFRILKLNNVRSVIAVVVLLVVVTGIIFASDNSLKGDVFMVVPMVICGMILVIFNVEVKRDILNLNALNRISASFWTRTFLPS